MPVSALNHYTIRCALSQVPALQAFYTDVIGLEPGLRPDIPEPGVWLYLGEQAIVHLYAYLPAPEARPAGYTTGPLDHISFRASDLEATRNHLRRLEVPFIEVPVPGMPIHQVFLHDPIGLRVELTFLLEQEVALATVPLSS